MPTYEYQCQGCKSLFDFFQSFSEEPLELCPLCNNHKPKRLISTPFFHIKEVKDVQTLAEKNSKRIGRQEIQERELKLKEKKMKAKKELAEKAGASLIKPSEEIPFWRKDDSTLDLSKISNVREYIETGAV